MLAWLSQNIYTILIIAALALVFTLMIRSLIRGRKSGKSSCCGGCAGCANACYCHPQGNDTPPADPHPSAGDQPGQS
jgi:hypothetical protein